MAPAHKVAKFWKISPPQLHAFSLVGTFVIFGARIHTVLLLKLVFISRQSVMAEIRLTHGVLCKLECTICMHQRRSSLFCWLEVHHSKSIFNMF